MLKRNVSLIVTLVLIGVVKGWPLDTRTFNPGVPTGLGDDEDNNIDDNNIDDNNIDDDNVDDNNVENGENQYDKKMLNQTIIIINNHGNGSCNNDNNGTSEMNYNDIPMGL